MIVVFHYCNDPFFQLGGHEKLSEETTLRAADDSLLDDTCVRRADGQAYWRETGVGDVASWDVWYGPENGLEVIYHSASGVS